MKRRGIRPFGLLNNGAPIALSLIPPLSMTPNLNPSRATDTAAFLYLSQPGRFLNIGHALDPALPPFVPPGPAKGRYSPGHPPPLFQTLGNLPVKPPIVIIGGILGDQRHVWKHDIARRMK